jgi:predicted neuraminidase
MPSTLCCFPKMSSASQIKAAGIRNTAVVTISHTDLPVQRAARLSSRLVLLACCVALVAALASEITRWSSVREHATAPALIETAEPRNVTLGKLSAALIPMPPGVPSAHASAMAAMPGDEMLAFWWAGSRESGPDVKIYASRWADGNWGAPREIASRESLGAALGIGIRRVGNPVAWTGRDGKINLFVVATGLGGWAASRVVHLVSSDHGVSFKVRRLLPMSPLFNTSVLVRTSPVGLADGGFWLPAYFELGIKYPMIMAFDDDGDPRWLARIGARTTTLQPAVVPVSAFEARAWMRDASDERRVQQAYSRDGGASWEDLPALDLPNHSSSVAAWRLTKGGFVLLHNHVANGASSRNVLRLSHSKDARSWEHIFDVASGNADEEFSYPTLQQVGDELHVTYTSRRAAIAHHVYRINYGEKLQ